MDLRVRVTESQYEALKAVAEASGDTLDEYLYSLCNTRYSIRHRFVFWTKREYQRKAIQKSWQQEWVKN